MKKALHAIQTATEAAAVLFLLAAVLLALTNGPGAVRVCGYAAFASALFAVVTIASGRNVPDATPER